MNNQHILSREDQHLKRFGIHRYVMHSFKGFQKGMDIHHINEDKFDNRLDNLVYLTRAEHISYHASHRPPEVVAKLRTSNQFGENNPMFGKTPWNKGKHTCTEEQKKILSNKARLRSTGRVWVNNGVISKFIYPNEIPEGFIRGRI